MPDNSKTNDMLVVSEAEYNTSPPTTTNGYPVANQADEVGKLKVLENGITRATADDGLLTNGTGSIAFASGDNLTTEKLTDAISISTDEIHPDGLYKLSIDKPTENTAGNLTISIYNQVKVDGTNSRNCLLTSLTVEVITGLATYRDFLIQGAFIGEGTIKIGMKFATDSEAITVYYKLYRV